MNIAARDNMINVLQKELKDRKKIVDERYVNIQKVKKNNEFLEKVAGDYHNHYEAIKKIKNEQMRSMKIIIELEPLSPARGGRPARSVST